MPMAGSPVFRVLGEKCFAHIDRIPGIVIADFFGTVIVQCDGNSHFITSQDCYGIVQISDRKSEKCTVKLYSGTEMKSRERVVGKEVEKCSCQSGRC